MRITRNRVLTASLLLLSTSVTAKLANAQINDQVNATISHSFVISTKTLPPGKYTFRMEGGSDGGVMIVTSADGKTSDQFIVRQSQARTTPAHTELVFRRYGDQEFLSKIFEGGNNLGVAVSEPSKLEKELRAKGQQATEHTEEGGG